MAGQLMPPSVKTVGNVQVPVRRGSQFLPNSKKVSGHLGGLPTKVLLSGVEVLLLVRKFTMARGMRKEHG